MSPKSRKIGTVVLLGCILVLWLVAQTIVSFREDDEYQAQMLAITDLEIEGSSGEDSVDVDSLRTDIESRLPWLASCLAAHGDSMAPASVVVDLMPEDGEQLTFAASETLATSDIECLGTAVEPIAWPAGATRITILLDTLEHQRDE